MRDMLGVISSIFGPIIDFFSDWFSKRQELKAEKWRTKMEIEKNKQRLARDQQNYNHEWEMANLTDKDKILRWVSFILFTSPFLVAMFAPHHMEVYFTKSLSVIPEWWKKTYMAMMGGIWGLSSLKNVVPSLVGQFVNKGKGKK
jgi:hypothetical protein